MNKLDEQTKSINSRFGEVIDWKDVWDEYYSVGTIPDIPYFTAKIIYEDFEKSEKVFFCYDEPKTGWCDTEEEAVDNLFRKIRAFIKYHTKTDDHSNEKILWRVKPCINSNIDFDDSGTTKYQGYARVHLILGG